LERKALFLRSKNAPKIKKVPLKLYQIQDFPEIGIAARALHCSTAQEGFRQSVALVGSWTAINMRFNRVCMGFWETVHRGLSVKHAQATLS
jgi:hypothetical protein